MGRHAIEPLRRTAIWAAALALLLALGCGDKAPAAKPAPAPEQAAASASSEAPAPQSRRLPEAGTWTVAYVGGAVSIDAFAAPRRPLLQQLAERAGFALEAAPGEWPPLTLRIDAQPLEAALPLLVGEFEYRAEWALEAGVHRLAKLTIGAPRAAARSMDGSTLRPGEVAASLQRALQEVRDGELGLSPEDALAQLDDADPEVRVRAVLALEAEGEGLTALVRAIESDADPRVRAAATVGLEDSEDFAAVQALVGALDDPDPEVITEAIDSLEFAGDASVVPYLQPLLAHGDARVRNAAANAIRLLGP